MVTCGVSGAAKVMNLADETAATEFWSSLRQLRLVLEVLDAIAVRDHDNAIVTDRETVRSIFFRVETDSCSRWNRNTLVDDRVANMCTAADVYALVEDRAFDVSVTVDANVGA